MQEYIDRFARRLDMDIESTRNAIKKFQEDLTKSVDPLYDFSWSLSTFTAAAKHNVAQELFAHFREPDGSFRFNPDDFEKWLKSQVDRLEKEILRRARSPKRSSSPTSCLATEEKTAAYTDQYEWLTQYARRIERERFVKKWCADHTPAIIAGGRVLLIGDKEYCVLRRSRTSQFYDAFVRKSNHTEQPQFIMKGAVSIEDATDAMIRRAANDAYDSAHE